MTDFLRRAWNSLTITGPVLPKPGAYTVTLDVNVNFAANEEALQHYRNIISQQIESRQFMADSFQDIKQAHADLKTALEAEMEQINAKLTDLAGAGSAAERAELIADIRSTTERITGIISDSPAGEEPGDGEPENEDESDGA